MGSPAEVLQKVTATLTGGVLSVVLFKDGTIMVSGYGPTKPTYRGLVTYWDNVPAVVGVRLTTFGTARADLRPNVADLLTIQTTVLQAQYINALIANQPSYFAAF